MTAPSSTSDLADALSQLSRTNSHMANLDRSLLDLQRIAEQLSLANEDQQHSPPIQNLPPELLCEIFAFTLPQMHERSPSAPQMHESPWVLGHVCRHWRTLALVCPPLWSCFVIASDMPARALPVLLQQLERAGGAPLDVLFRWNQGDLWKAHTDEARSAFIAHCARWRRLHLQIAIVDLMPQLQLAAARGNVPLLRELVCTGEALRYLKDGLLADAPNLRKVVLDDSGNRVSDVPLPWSQITSYTASFSGLQHFNALRMAPNVVECYITFSMSYSNLFPDPGASLTLRHLRRLTVTNDKFLDCLVAPALEDLRIEGAIDRVLPFVQRSACALTHLALQTCRTSALVLDLLQSLPSLASLWFGSPGPADTNTIILALTLRGAGPCLCPNLTSLSWCDTKDYLDRAAFVDMVESRWRVPDGHCRPLRQVAVYTGRVRMKSHGRRLQALDGLVFTILNGRMARPAMQKWKEW
ncbi:hypothetical protein B0H10DRAFT_2032427 [Mycena sp. CBHHK59/15]|nr:hypothetical protein B0H10DRAFT_2032427 [Mycena sp. CBHHK59/15]